MTKLGKELYEKICDPVEQSGYRTLHPDGEHYIKDMLYIKVQLERDVEYACANNRGNCADCGKTSQYIVVEKSKDKHHRHHEAWYWCGVCRVG
tara:strand:+ start:92 stop:370 length:279 start_codon:yes stop_codon:yes gene_type:complete